MAKNVYIGASKQFSVTNLLDYNALSGNDGGYWGQYTFGTRYVVWSAAAPTGGNHSLLFNQNFSTGTAEATYQLTIKTGYIKVHLIPSHKYYFSVYLRQPSVVGSFDCYWPIAEPPVLQGVTVTAANTWQKKSTIVDRASFSEGDYEVRVDFNNPTTGSTLYVSNLVLVDLTATFGAGGEPDQAWCDANLDFNDTASDSAADTATITATGSVARRAKNIYIGVGGKARKVKKAYIGVGGKARLFYTSTLPPAIVDLWSTNSNGDTVKSITYANGYWVVGGSYRHANSNATTAQIAYTTSVNSPWTTVSVWETTSNNNTINCIAYANGYWMVGGEYRYKTSSYKARIAYATSLDGPWTIVNLWDNYESGGGVNDITYANGYWVVCGNYRGRSSNRATIAYATSPNSDWTTKDLWSSGSSHGGTATGIAYANGYWVVGGTYENSSDTFGRIAYATSLDGTWEKKDVWSGDEIERLTYANGNWIVCGRMYGTGDSDARIAYAANPSGPWTQSIVWSGFQETRAVGATYADGHWVVYGVQYENSTYYARIAYATSLNGPWTTKDLWNSNKNKNLICGMDYDGTYWMAGGEYADTTYYYARIAYSADLSEFDQI